MSPRVRVTIIERSIWGSLIDDDKHDDDSLVDVSRWVETVLSKVPAQYRNEVKINIMSVGGDAYHTDIEVYYYRHETEIEKTTREFREATQAANIERRERKQFEALKRKFGG